MVENFTLEYDEKTKPKCLQSACSGCPSSTTTLKGGIEQVLKISCQI